MAELYIPTNNSVFTAVPTTGLTSRPGDSKDNSERLALEGLSAAEAEVYVFISKLLEETFGPLDSETTPDRPLFANFEQVVYDSIVKIFSSSDGSDDAAKYILEKLKSVQPKKAETAPAATENTAQKTVSVPVSVPIQESAGSMKAEAVSEDEVVVDKSFMEKITGVVDKIRGNVKARILAFRKAYAERGGLTDKAEELGRQEEAVRVAAPKPATMEVPRTEARPDVEPPVAKAEPASRNTAAVSPAKASFASKIKTPFDTINKALTGHFQKLSKIIASKIQKIEIPAAVKSLGQKTPDVRAVEEPQTAKVEPESAKPAGEKQEAEEKPDEESKYVEVNLRPLFDLVSNPSVLFSSSDLRGRRKSFKSRIKHKIAWSAGKTLFKLSPVGALGIALRGVMRGMLVMGHDRLSNMRIMRFLKTPKFKLPKFRTLFGPERIRACADEFLEKVCAFHVGICEKIYESNSSMLMFAYFGATIAISKITSALKEVASNIALPLVVRILKLAFSAKTLLILLGLYIGYRIGKWMYGRYKSGGLTSFASGLLGKARKTFNFISKFILDSGFRQETIDGFRNRFDSVQSMAEHILEKIENAANAADGASGGILSWIVRQLNPERRWSIAWMVKNLASGGMNLAKIVFTLAKYAVKGLWNYPRESGEFAAGWYGVNFGKLLYEPIKAFIKTYKWKILKVMVLGLGPMGWALYPLINLAEKKDEKDKKETDEREAAKKNVISDIKSLYNKPSDSKAKSAMARLDANLAAAGFGKKVSQIIHQMEFNANTVFNATKAYDDFIVTLSETMLYSHKFQDMAALIFKSEEFTNKLMSVFFVLDPFTGAVMPTVPNVSDFIANVIRVFRKNFQKADDDANTDKMIETVKQLFVFLKFMNKSRAEIVTQSMLGFKRRLDEFSKLDTKSVDFTREVKRFSDEIMFSRFTKNAIKGVGQGYAKAAKGDSTEQWKNNRDEHLNYKVSNAREYFDSAGLTDKDTIETKFKNEWTPSFNVSTPPIGNIVPNTDQPIITGTDAKDAKSGAKTMQEAIDDIAEVADDSHEQTEEALNDAVELAKQNLDRRKNAKPEAAVAHNTQIVGGGLVFSVPRTATA